MGQCVALFSSNLRTFGADLREESCYFIGGEAIAGLIPPSVSRISRNKDIESPKFLHNIEGLSHNVLSLPLLARCEGFALGRSGRILCFNLGVAHLARPSDRCAHGVHYDTASHTKPRHWVRRLSEYIRAKYDDRRRRGRGHGERVFHMGVDHCTELCGQDNRM